MKNAVHLREFRRITSAKLAGFCPLLLLVLVWAAPIHSQSKSVPRSGEAAETPVLEPGKPTENSLAGGASYSYRITAEEGQFLHARVEQFGIHVSLTLYDPGRKAIASMENLNGRAGLQQISALARLRGTYTLKLASSDQTAPPGSCRVLLEPLRAPTAADRILVTAQQTFMNAGEIYRQAAANSSVRAAREYERALSLWESAGDKYEESLTLNMLGNLYLDLGDRTKALDDFQQALPITQALGDQKGEAAARQNIGAVYYTNGEKAKALDQFTAALAFERETNQHSMEAETLSYLGEVLMDLGQEEAALADFEQALVVVQQLGDQRAAASVHTNIGKIHDDL